MADWNALYNADRRPAPGDIAAFVNSVLWEELHAFLQDGYGVLPQLAYSGCSMQRGWNVKYKKGGKSLCTLYPMDGFFIALVVIGEREAAQADLLLPLCSDYTRALYARTASYMGGRWLMLEVTDAQILEDIKRLIHLRVPIPAEKRK